MGAYRGVLSPADAAQGMVAARENAGALLADARFLFEDGRVTRVVGLAVLAMEELGRIHLLRSLVLARNDAERREIWSAVGAHTPKSFVVGIPILARTAASLEAFGALMDQRRLEAVLEAFKELSFHAQFEAGLGWVTPEAHVSREAAEAVLVAAESLVVERAAFETEAELEIFVRHLKPVWRTDMGAMREALMRCGREAEAAGVLGASFDLDRLEALLAEV